MFSPSTQSVFTSRPLQCYRLVDSSTIVLFVDRKHLNQPHEFFDSCFNRFNSPHLFQTGEVFDLLLSFQEGSIIFHCELFGQVLGDALDLTGHICDFVRLLTE